MRRSDTRRHLFVFILAGLSATFLQLALYIRPGPLGVPFSQTPAASFFRGAAREWLTLAALSLPLSFLGALVSSRRHTKAAKAVLVVHIAAVFIALTLGHAEHELQRFMGTRLTLDYLATYGRLGQSPAAIGYALADDAGGAYSSLFLAILPVLFLLAASLALSRERFFFHLRSSPPIAKGRYTSVFLVALIAPPAGSAPSPTSHTAASPSRTGVGVLWDAVFEALNENTGPPPSSEDFRRARKIWLQRGENSRWVFPDAQHPLWRVPSRPCPAPSDRPLNFVVIQLETFRAMDMHYFNPKLDARPTPFLDALARDPKSSSWVRFYANGLPTVSAFMAIHTSLLPHSRKRVATAFRGVALDAFPSLLRKEGYRAVFITGADPSWDRQRDWAELWYDEVIFDPKYDGRDDFLLEDAATRLLDPNFSRRPFVVTVVTSTNHLPFRLPGADAEDDPHLTPRRRLHRTMAFTDHALKNFFDEIRDTDWFHSTVFVLTGDHGYDLGERGISGRMTNLRHENTWVPLIIHGDHPSIPRGRLDTVASHVDIAPTLLSLAGVCRPNAFFGHDLTHLEASSGFAFTVREGAMALETDTYSFYFPPTGDPLVYRANDFLQRLDVYRTLPGNFVVHFEELANGLRRVFDGLYETDLVRPHRVRLPQ